jgi:hypothetical protein
MSVHTQECPFSSSSRLSFYSWPPIHRYCFSSSFSFFSARQSPIELAFEVCGYGATPASNQEMGKEKDNDDIFLYFFFVFPL